ncbi:MAG: type I-F CRISPR-associated helicase Cas3f [Arenicella sp.]
MMVTFISQCEKKALTRTRRVLDAFADRIGNNTWQTVITQEGLLAVKKLLRKTASKNTAVSCHWMRSRKRSEVVWVVGNRGKFNGAGLVPVNRTRANLLKTDIENDWVYLPLIKALVAMSALLHDWGKASALFQDKLKPEENKSFKGDPIRHEWVSCLLLNALIQTSHTDSEQRSDKDWLSLLAKGEIDEKTIQQVAKEKTERPLSQLPPVAKLVAWLIVSHHRLPLLSDKDKREQLKGDSAESIEHILQKISKEWGYENRYDEAEYQARLHYCFTFPKGLMSQSKKWFNEVQKWSKRLFDAEKLATKIIEDGSYRSVLSYSRLCLMLGDHYYSSQESDKKWRSDTGLFANTDRETSQLKQKLDEHLFGVAKQGLRNAHLLPAFESELPMAKDVIALKKLSPPDYKWQDKAVNKIKGYLDNNAQVSAEKQGFFVVNMASTGCGKTFANAKVMRALSGDGDSLRFVLALGLRTLTLQTGDEYRDRVGLDDTELAVVIGSQVVADLHHQRKFDLEKEEHFERSGSFSEETLLDQDIDFDCAIPEDGLATLFRQQRDRKFLYAPVLACTIDHLMAATETKRGGRYILPTLRLMSSDLVIDEIDDFTGHDLVAIGRLIHLAGMLGRKVMISSATIPPDLAEGYFKAYRDGWRLFCQARDASPGISCVWIDEFDTKVSSNTGNELRDAILSYREAHKQFIQKRVEKLDKQPIKRKAIINSCESIFSAHKSNHNDEAVKESKQRAYFKIALDSAVALHTSHHSVDKISQLKVSFGVMRVANIQPCVALTDYLLNVACPPDTEIRVMAYHSQQILLLRHEQEQHLDEVLKRKEQPNEAAKAFTNKAIREHLDSIHQRMPEVDNVLFVLVATPVEEVGRDHDFDWAVIEPSSYRSIIQLAGRVRRHRAGDIAAANVGLMQYNWQGIEYQHLDDQAVFTRPGFEENGLILDTHDLNELVDVATINKRLDAKPRIQKDAPLQETKKLADLEHYATAALLTQYNSKCVGPKTLRGYLKEAWFLTALPQYFTPFRQGQSTTKVFVVFNADEEEYEFCEKNERGYPVNRQSFLGIQRQSLTNQQIQRLWLQRDFNQSVEQLAEQQEKSLRSISIRYGELSFRHSEGKRYGYSDQLGVFKL